MPDFAQRHAVRDELWRLLAGLPRTQRAVLVLRFYEDLDDQRIAEVLGCAPATVRVHARRPCRSPCPWYRRATSSAFWRYTRPAGTPA
jgi:RNA polymerase sigma factor (sigma-70 family)